MTDDEIRTNWEAYCDDCGEWSSTNSGDPCPSECDACGGGNIEIRQSSFHHFKWTCDRSTTFAEIIERLDAQTAYLKQVEAAGWQIEDVVDNGMLRLWKEWPAEEAKTA